MATSEARAAWRPYEESEHQKSIHTQVQAHLETRDTDANVRSLDHTDIIRAVADRERHRAHAVLDEPHDERLLQRRDAAAHHALALHREPQEQVLVLIVS